MEKKIRFGNLFVFYGKLLTDKQYELLDYYYLNDYSMVEIAENIGISRQAVYDAVKKSNRALESYESKMGLYAKFQRISEYSRKIIEKSGGILEVEKNEKILEDVSGIMKLAVEIMEVNNR